MTIVGLPGVSLFFLLQYTGGKKNVRQERGRQIRLHDGSGLAGRLGYAALSY